jgi:ABC-type multidrug transport system fused ATPase/permease subunit
VLPAARRCHRRRDRQAPRRSCRCSLAVGAATIVGAFTSFALSSCWATAAQRAIADMRKRVLAHVTRLPIRCLTRRTGILIARVMNDAEASAIRRHRPG